MNSANYEKAKKLLILSSIMMHKFNTFDNVIEKYKEKEYNKLIKKNNKIERRFQKIYKKLNKKEKMKIDGY